MLQNKWKEAIGEGGAAKVKGVEKGSMRALAALGDGGGLSEFDFYVTLKDKRQARLAVTKESIQTYVQGAQPLPLFCFSRCISFTHSMCVA